MLRKIWQRFRESEAEHRRRDDELATERALREHDEAQRDGLAEGDRLAPPFKNTDWSSR
jgi:hypothetical protein